MDVLDVIPFVPGELYEPSHRGELLYCFGQEQVSDSKAQGLQLQQPNLRPIREAAERCSRRERAEFRFCVSIDAGDRRPQRFSIRSGVSEAEQKEGFHHGRR